MPRWLCFNCRTDLRSLGLFRILFAAVLIGDWFARWRDVTAFYTSEGVFPNALRLLAGATAAQFTLLDWFDSPAAVRCFFLASLACYVLLLLGWRTRWVVVASLVAFISIGKRNLFVLIGADQVIVTMLFWAALLPLGKRFSLDARRHRHRDLEAAEEVNGFQSAAVLGATLQIAMIYLCTAIAKSGQTWIDGEAMYFAINFAAPRTALARWISAAPLGTVQALTWSVLALEYAAAPLVLSPWGQPYLRRIIMALLVAMHLGITWWMDVGAFSYVMIASYAILLGEKDWALMRRIAARWTPRFAGKTSDGASQSWARASRLENVLAAVFMAYCVSLAFAQNVLPRWWGEVRLPGAIAWLSETTLVSQNWNMFAPDPPRYSRWWVCDGTLEDGAHWDPLTGTEPRLAKPGASSQPLRVAWREFMKRAWGDGDPPTMALIELRRHFCRYLVEHSPAPPADGKRITSLRIDFYRDRPLGPEVSEPFGTQAFDLGNYDRESDRYTPGERAPEWIVWHSLEQAKARGASRDEQRDGPWTFWFANGRVQETGTFERGERTGKWTTWDERGVLQRAIHLSDGKLNGPAEFRLPDGRLESGSYVDDQREGAWVTTFADGGKSEEGSYVAGKREGRWTAWFPNGQQQRSAELTADVPNGEYSEWFENGQLMKQGRYVHGQANGPWTYWHANGKKQMEGAYRKGQREGLWKVWNAAGKLEAEQEFREGKPVEGK